MRFWPYWAAYWGWRHVRADRRRARQRYAKPVDYTFDPPTPEEADKIVKGLQAEATLTVYGLQPRQLERRGLTFDEAVEQLKPEDRDHVDEELQRAVGMESSSGVAAEAEPSGVSDLPGFALTSDDLRELRFRPLDLRVLALDVPLASGATGCTWDTVGDVPDAPGLYAFTVENGEGYTVEHGERLAVVYVGRTEQLWMVTKGQLPSGTSRGRGGQRYGRPKHAGETRKRINGLVREQLLAGRTVRHWICPMRGTLPAQLAESEEALISRWQLRRVGWNLR
jgi:hypothetical protein